LIPLQGVATVLQAARLAPDLRFRIVGSGQLEPLLRQRPPNVEHVPWVDYERLPRELHNAGCALGVFGTSAKAGRVIPNKVFQALACGAPVITADSPAARELLVDGASAQLVPPGDASALAAAVRAWSAATLLAGVQAHRLGTGCARLLARLPALSGDRVDDTERVPPGLPRLPAAALCDLVSGRGSAAAVCLLRGARSPDARG